METHGIGTDASMATHINNICERNYVSVTGSGRRLIPTDLGASLIHGYQLIDPDLVAPTLRSNIEKSVDMIAKVNNCTYVSIIIFIGKS
jgi:DNA topoisomerase-3